MARGSQIFGRRNRRLQPRHGFGKKSLRVSHPRAANDDRHGLPSRPFVPSQTGLRKSAGALRYVMSQCAPVPCARLLANLPENPLDQIAAKKTSRRFPSASVVMEPSGEGPGRTSESPKWASFAAILKVLVNQRCRGGGIGRRARLRIWWRNP